MRVLIVDDEPDLRYLSELILRGGGYDTVEAAGGAEALEILESRSDIDVVLLDIRMPHVDGFAVLARLKAVDLLEGVKVLAVSAHAERDLMERAVADGAAGWVQKPFLPDDLLAAVAAVLQ